jgi:hypothetical protein
MRSKEKIRNKKALSRKFYEPHAQCLWNAWEGSQIIFHNASPSSKFLILSFNIMNFV